MGFSTVTQDQLARVYSCGQWDLDTIYFPVYSRVCLPPLKGYLLIGIYGATTYEVMIQLRLTGCLRRRLT